ncbi:MAG: tRNA (adenosine(37)-N6)-threonylcarbamoyltransferase complex ATPase subunit type 1 TsaE [Candidatus Eisenbacteria bacterium]|nr:tRNA (adenosine(37)-N6)-threonylcarbamoyltransferase complex ATPase subunit type 1 TsaE [Candidatus Eisenbacteria bacterium]
MRLLTLDAVSDSESQTLRFGERLGAALRSRAVIGLTGPLGAGKTRIVQGLARGIGYAGRVRSPSFTLLNVYRGKAPLRHLDLYRIDALDDGTAGEWEEAMEEEGFTAIEWADRMPDLLPAEAIWLDLQPESSGRRRIRLRLALPSPMLDVWRVG